MATDGLANGQRPQGAEPTDEVRPIRDVAWQRAYDEKADRENRLTWPVVEQFLGVWTRRDGWSDRREFGCALPGSFDLQITDDDAEHIRKAVERTVRREFRKLWDRRVDRLAAGHADRRAAARAAVRVPTPADLPTPDDAPHRQLERGG